MTDKQTVEDALKWLKVLETNIRDGGCDVDSPIHKHLKKFLNKNLNLTNLYDKAELLEWLDGEKKDESTNNYSGQPQHSKTHNLALDVVITKIKEM